MISIFKKYTFLPRELFPLDSKYKTTVIAVSLLQVIKSAIDISLPFIMSHVLYKLVSGATDGSLGYELGGFLLLALVRALCVVCKSLLQARFQMRVLVSLRNQICRSLLLLTSGNNRSVGGMIASLSSDLQVLGDFLWFTVWESGGEALFLISSGIALFITSPALAISACLPIPVILLINIKLFPRFERAFINFQATSSDMGDQFQELLEGRDITNTFQCHEKVRARFDKRNIALSETALSLNRLAAIYSPFYEWIGSLSMGLLLLTGSYFIGKNIVQGKDVITFILYLSFFYRPLFASGKLVDQWQKSFLSFRRLNQLRLNDSVDKSPSPQKHLCVVANSSSGITLRSVSFSYRSDTPLFRDLNVSFKKDKITGIIGYNGAGKSTLVKIIAGVLSPESGYITIHDALNRTHIAYLPQEPFLFSGSILENLQITSPNLTEKDYLYFAEILGIKERILSLPQGFHTQVGSRGSSLSGGQRQSISLLRFACKIDESALCILDEPTTYIDLETEKALSQSLLKLCKNKTTIIVSHRPETLISCDEIIALNDGILHLTEKTAMHPLVTGNFNFPEGPRA